MFSSKERLKKRTPAGGIGREEYIGHLVDEFYTTTNVEAQEQVTANLANFAYDPINYEFLKKSSALELFLQCISLPNQKLNIHGIAGICNLCLDDESQVTILQPNNLNLLFNLLLNSYNSEIIINCLTTLAFLVTPKTKSSVCVPKIVKEISELRTSTNPRIRNLATVFVEDYCTIKKTEEKKC